MTENQTERNFNVKGSDRIEINNLLSAVCLGILSLFLMISNNNISLWILMQLALAIPCLIVSSLSYAKICYRPQSQIKYWDTFGWITHTLGYILIINSIALLLHQRTELFFALLFTIIAVCLFVIYSVIDMIVDRESIIEKVIKISSFLIIIFLGSWLPILINSI